MSTLTKILLKPQFGEIFYWNFNSICHSIAFGQKFQLSAEILERQLRKCEFIQNCYLIARQSHFYDSLNKLFQILAVCTLPALVPFQSLNNSLGNMNFNISRSLSVFLAILIAQAACQDRSVVEVVEYLKTNHETGDKLCPATLISEKHVLTTAACAKASSHLFDLAVELPLTNSSNAQETRSKEGFKAEISEFLIAQNNF